MFKKITCILSIFSCVLLCSKLNNRIFSNSNNGFSGNCLISEKDGYGSDYIDGNSGFEYAYSLGTNAIFCNNYQYFIKLNDWHGSNVNRTCTVIASQILFGYYDTFYNDEIIPEEMDCMTEDIEESIDNFSQSPGSGEEFHQYLITFARDNGISNDCSNIPIPIVEELFTTYLQSRSINFDYTCIKGNIVDTTNNSVSNYIRNSVDNGKPLMVGALGHMFVVFGYDNDYVYLHLGQDGIISKLNWSYINTTILSPTGHISALGLDAIYGKHIHSNNYFSITNDEYICPCGAKMKNLWLNPGDFGFEAQYFFYEKQKRLNITDVDFDTTRLRTGFIENEFINLSPRRQGAGVSYFEINLYRNIKAFDVFLSLWSEFEDLNPSDSTLVLQYFDSFEFDWVTKYNFLQEGSIGFDRTSQDEYIFTFPRNVKRIRFYSSSSAVGTRNKGRLSIGNMKFIYEI